MLCFNVLTQTRSLVALSLIEDDTHWDCTAQGTANSRKKSLVYGHYFKIKPDATDILSVPSSSAGIHSQHKPRGGALGLHQLRQRCYWLNCSHILIPVKINHHSSWPPNTAPNYIHPPSSDELTKSTSSEQRWIQKVLQYIRRKIERVNSATKRWSHGHLGKIPPNSCVGKYSSGQAGEVKGSGLLQQEPGAQ